MIYLNSGSTYKVNTLAPLWAYQSQYLKIINSLLPDLSCVYLALYSRNVLRIVSRDKILHFKKYLN